MMAVIFYSIINPIDHCSLSLPLTFSKAHVFNDK